MFLFEQLKTILISQNNEIKLNTNIKPLKYKKERDLDLN
jgi:hypothetical protein